MIDAKRYKSEFDKLITDEYKEASVYIIGSASRGARTPFNVTLSDVDLMLIAEEASSFDSLTNLIKRAYALNDRLNMDGDAVELFFALPHTASFYLSYLSITAGINHFLEEDRLCGREFKPMDITSKAIAREMYFHAAIELCHEFAKKLPNADTKYARRTAKRILRTLKIVVCAQASRKDFESTEAKLLHLHDFKDLAAFLPELHSIAPMWNKVLKGEDVKDWPQWMREQNTLAMQFASWAQKFEYDVGMHQLFSTLCDLRDMLIVDAKNLIGEKDEAARGVLVGQYADKLAGMVVKLALLGISSLGDLSTSSTPAAVRDAYFKLLEHLQNERNDIGCLAASIILGDYALDEATKYLTRDSKAEML